MARKFAIDSSKYDFRFTRNWFLNRNYSTFVNYVMPQWAGKPITYLEIGVFEGMSLVWMMQHVLTHPQARAVGIDPWLMTTKLDPQVMQEVMERAYHNIACFLPRCCLIRANSAEVLRRMNHKGCADITKGSVDLCMIDGDHNRLAVYDDAVQVFDLMKPGGWMLFDDVENDRPKKDHVADGLAMFRHEYEPDRIKFLWKDRYMEAFEKL